MVSSGRRGHDGTWRHLPHLSRIRYTDWKVTDPAGMGSCIVRRIHDDIEQRVRVLLDEIDVRAE